MSADKEDTRIRPNVFASANCLIARSLHSLTVLKLGLSSSFSLSDNRWNHPVFFASHHSHFLVSFFSAPLPLLAKDTEKIRQRDWYLPPTALHHITAERGRTPLCPGDLRNEIHFQIPIYADAPDQSTLYHHQRRESILTTLLDLYLPGSLPNSTAHAYGLLYLIGHETAAVKGKLRLYA